MKKILASCLSVALLFSLSGCKTCDFDGNCIGGDQPQQLTDLSPVKLLSVTPTGDVTRVLNKSNNTRNFIVKFDKIVTDLTIVNGEQLGGIVVNPVLAGTFSVVPSDPSKTWEVVYTAPINTEISFTSFVYLPIDLQATDLNGNQFQFAMPDQSFSVDTREPTLVSYTPQVYLAADSSQSTLTFSFSESVGQPSLIFSDANGDELSAQTDLRLAWTSSTDNKTWTVNLTLLNRPTDLILKSVEFFDLALNGNASSDVTTFELGEYRFTTIDVEVGSSGAARASTEVSQKNAVYYSTNLASQVSSGFAEQALKIMHQNLELTGLSNSNERYRGVVSIGSKEYNATLLKAMRDPADKTYLVYLENGEDAAIYGQGPVFTGLTAVAGLITLSGDFVASYDIISADTLSQLHSNMGTFTMTLDLSNNTFDFSTMNEVQAVVGESKTLRVDGPGVFNVSTGRIASDSLTLTVNEVIDGVPVTSQRNVVAFGNLHGAADTVTGVIFDDNVDVGLPIPETRTIGGFIGTR